MKFYSGWEWLLIDAASQYGHDKLTFEKRIEWSINNLSNLENELQNAETKPLYQKAVLAIRKAQKGIPTGHMVGVDASCSGIQLMSALTGCISGADATGLVDPDRRADAYTQTTDEMNKLLAGAVEVSRKDAKRAVMTTMYGSKKTPKEIFGEDSPELLAFYQAVMNTAPGAWDLLQTLLNAWNPHTLAHSWKLPDGYDARVKVMDKKTVRVEVDELDHASFTYEFYENVEMAKGISLPANLIHSVDGFVLREMHRRCNYDLNQVQHGLNLITKELYKRTNGGSPDTSAVTSKGEYYLNQYSRSSYASAVIIPHLNEGLVAAMSTEHLEAVMKLLEGMLQHKPFPLVTVHDEFKSSPSNVNWVRWHYKEILAELAESTVLDDLLSQLHGEPGTFPKLSFNLPELIRNSNYALC